MSKILRLFSVAFLLSAMAAVALGQSQANTGQISGEITDTNGAAVPGATVTATNKENGLKRSVSTSEDGLYTIVLLPPGSYTVVAEAQGFANSTVDEVVVNVGRVIEIKLTLGAGGVQESVTVTAEAIQVTRNESDAVLNETAITNLPINGRRFQDFVTLTPTAQVDPQRGQISLSGQKGINSNINVDGVDYNQPFFGGIRGGERANLAFTIPQESIREFQVVASGYSAEFGRSSGGIVNAVTKSGTNDYHGSAFYLLRPEKLARGNEFTEALQDQRLTAAGVDATLAPTQHQFGGSLGGPIKQDRVFFFGSLEGQRFNAPRQILFGIPNSFTAANASQQGVLDFYRAEQVGYTLTNNAWALLGKVDWHINSNHSFNARYSHSRNNAENAVSRGETSLDPTTTQALSTNGTEQNRTHIAVAQLISNFGSNSINELRLQYAKEIRPRLSNSEFPQILTSFATYGATAFLPTTQFDTRWQVADGFTILTGNHNIKFGGEYSRLFADQEFGFNQFGQYVLSAGSGTANFRTALQFLSDFRGANTAAPGGFQLGRFDFATGTGTLRYLRQIGNLQASFKVHELAYFVQDSWRVTPKFTANFGFRIEQQFNPTPEVNNDQVVNTVRNTIFPIRGTGYNPFEIPDSGWQLGPRVGFAWDPEGDGKTVVRGYGGYYYARTPLLVLAGSVNNFRVPPGDVSTQLPFTSFSQSAFTTFAASAAGANYRAITGCNPALAPLPQTCVPNTLYRQFAIAGVNLNSSPLSNLPILSLDQISTIAGALGLAPNPFVGAQVTGHAEDFKNPRSLQFGFAVEREIARNFIVGIDYSHVKTDRVQRNRDLNLPGPLTAGEYVDFIRANNSVANFNALVANGTIGSILEGGRTFIAINTPAGLTTTGLSGLVLTRRRPTQDQGGLALGSVQIRESTAKGLYDAVTFRSRLVRKQIQFNAYYTLSRNLTDDDNERDAGGVAYMDPYDLHGEYNYSRLDRRHQFVANPIVFLPFDFDVSSAIRLRSGTPLNSTANGDLNGDGVNNDRPVLLTGFIQKRNEFRNKRIYDIDLRVQKGFSFGEDRKLTLSSEFFNLFNLSNIIFPTPNTATSSGASGQFCSVASQTCGLAGPTNPAFLQTRNAAGEILINNVNPGSQVFQMQLGVRFQF